MSVLPGVTTARAVTSVSAVSVATYACIAVGKVKKAVTTPASAKVASTAVNDWSFPGITNSQ